MLVFQNQMLPFLSWEPALVQHTGMSQFIVSELAKLALMGIEEFDAKASNLVDPIALGQDAWALCRESAIRMTGSMSDLGVSTASLDPIASEASGWGSVLWAERRFLQGFARNRLGFRDEAIAIWQSIRDFSEQCAGLEPVVAAIELEECVILLNKGLFKSCVAKLEALLASESLKCAIGTIRALAVLGLCYSGQGNFAQVERVLALELACLDQFKSSTMSMAFMRRRIDFHMAREEYQLALRLLEETLAKPQNSKTTHAFLLELKARLFLIRNRLTDARAVLDELEGFIKDGWVPLGVINILEEWCEFFLREKRPLDAMPLIEKSLLESFESGDLLYQFKSQIYHARALTLLGDHAGALEVVEKALLLGEAQGFGLELVEGLFHAAGIAHRVGDWPRCLVFLTRAGRLARKMALHLRAACFDYLRVVMARSKASLLPFFELLKHPELGQELIYYLDFYGILAQTMLSMRRGSEVFVLSEGQVRNLILGTAASFWFPAEKIVVNGDGRKLRLLELAKQPKAAKLFERLSRSREGIGLEDVHRLHNKSHFHPLRHSGQARTLIYRLRKALRELTLDIHFDRDRMRYSLKFQAELVTIRAVSSQALGASAAGSGLGVMDLRDGSDLRTSGQQLLRQDVSRIEQIHEIIRQSGRKTTTELCRELGVSRQALHPHLTRLVREGKVKLVKRGPLTSYVAVDVHPTVEKRTAEKRSENSNRLLKISSIS